MLRLVATRALSTAATTTPVSRAYLEASGKVNNPQHSNAEDLIAKVKTIYVQGSEAVCDGGGGALGHPVEASAILRPPRPPATDALTRLLSRAAACSTFSWRHGAATRPRANIAACAVRSPPPAVAGIHHFHNQSPRTTTTTTVNNRNQTYKNPLQNLEEKKQGRCARAYMLATISMST